MIVFWSDSYYICCCLYDVWSCQRPMAAFGSSNLIPRRWVSQKHTIQGTSKINTDPYDFLLTQPVFFERSRRRRQTLNSKSMCARYCQFGSAIHRKRGFFFPLLNFEKNKLGLKVCVSGRIKEFFFSKNYLHAEYI